MAPSRKRRQRSSRITDEAAANWHADFRASEDDAWYAVALRVEESCLTMTTTVGEAVLRVMFCGFEEQWDERFKVSEFKGEEEVEEFRKRFRRKSSQLQDDQCRKVVKGMTVCASSVFDDSELKFYDAIVHSVCYGDHKFVNGKELCTCNFTLHWQHGPNYGRITSTGVEGICLLQYGNEEIDPVLDMFLELVMRNLGLPQQSSSGNQESAIVHKPNGPDSRDGCKFSEVTHDLDLGGNYMPKVADLKNNYYIWIENVEKDLLPEIIVGFLYYHTSILTEVLVLPTLCSVPYTRATIFVDTREKTVKLSDLLCNPERIIVSTNGRPWVISEKKWIYGSLCRLTPKIEWASASDDRRSTLGYAIYIGKSLISWSSASDDCRSTLGYAICLGKLLISWSFTKKSTVACSGTEVEYRAIMNVIAGAELSWPSSLLSEHWCNLQETLYFILAQSLSKLTHFVQDKVTAK